MRWFVSFFTILATLVMIAEHAAAQEFTVYGVYKALDLGNANEIPQKDFYVNMGKSNGVREGTVLEVMRRTPTYDAVSEKLYKEVTYPIAKLKVIHSENNAAIARLDKLLPPEKTPATNPRAVMVGDLVKIAGSD